MYTILSFFGLTNIHALSERRWQNMNFVIWKMRKTLKYGVTFPSYGRKGDIKEAELGKVLPQYQNRRFS